MLFWIVFKSSIIHYHSTVQCWKTWILHDLSELLGIKCWKYLHRSLFSEAYTYDAIIIYIQFISRYFWVLYDNFTKLKVLVVHCSYMSTRRELRLQWLYQQQTTIGKFRIHDIKICNDANWPVEVLGAMCAGEAVTGA